MPLLTAEHPRSERQTLDEIYDCYLGVTGSLVAHRAVVGDGLLNGTISDPRFVGFSETDVREYFDAQQAELDRLTSINFVGSAEASIRPDFARRVDGRLPDPLVGFYPAANAHQKVLGKRFPVGRIEPHRGRFYFFGCH